MSSSTRQDRAYGSRDRHRRTPGEAFPENGVGGCHEREGRNDHLALEAEGAKDDLKTDRRVAEPLRHVRASVRAAISASRAVKRVEVRQPAAVSISSSRRWSAARSPIRPSDVDGFGNRRPTNRRLQTSTPNPSEETNTSRIAEHRRRPYHDSSGPTMLPSPT
jgi:hypothetical protein